MGLFTPKQQGLSFIFRIMSTHASLKHMPSEPVVGVGTEERTQLVHGVTLPEQEDPVF